MFTSKHNITHSQMVDQLAKDGHVILAEMLPVDMHLLHMAIGVSGEVGELLELEFGPPDEPNWQEEFGDVEFYLAGYFDTMPKTAEPLDLEEPLVYLARNYGTEACSLIALTIEASKLLDATKKAAIYAAPLNLSKAVQALVNIRFVLDQQYTLHGFAAAEVLEANMDKLKLRYPDFGYSNSAAALRADKQVAQVEPTNPVDSLFEDAKANS